MTPRPPIVEVEWIDACEDSSDSHKVGTVPAKVGLIRRFTVGYLLHSCDNLCDTRVCGPDPRLVTARNYDPNGTDDDPEVSSFETIPLGWVRHTRYLTRKPKKVKSDG